MPLYAQEPTVGIDMHLQSNMVARGDAMSPYHKRERVRPLQSARPIKQIFLMHPMGHHSPPIL